MYFDIQQRLIKDSGAWYAKVIRDNKDFDVDDTGVIIVTWENGLTTYFESGWWQPHTDGLQASTQVFMARAASVKCFRPT